MQQTLAYAAIGALGVGAIFSSFPLWKSATLSPDSVERRVWWTCCAATAVLLFFSQLPDWRSGLFVSIMTAVALFFVAGFWTNFVKINGRVYGAFSQGRPDRPPALAQSDGDEDDEP
ncbi:hypothetical protein [Mycolicibacterium sarraceniae]|nr:hypothetical protein [Mycolicibacterium sarraceniae]